MYIFSDTTCMREFSLSLMMDTLLFKQPLTIEHVEQLSFLKYRETVVSWNSFICKHCILELDWWILCYTNQEINLLCLAFVIMGWWLDHNCFRSLFSRRAWQWSPSLGVMFLQWIICSLDSQKGEQKTMNRDVGSITLGNVYDSLLRTSHPRKLDYHQALLEKQWSESVVIKSSSHYDEN